jgi:subtilisin-like proprotein convertase family protein
MPIASSLSQRVVASSPHRNVPSLPHRLLLAAMRSINTPRHLDVVLMLVSVVTLMVGTSTLAQTFSSSTSISLPSIGTATPYPSTITVSGVVNNVRKVTVTLGGFSHPHPADMQFVLTSPLGKSVHIMTGCGGSAAVANLTLTFDDEAQSYAPQTNLGGGNSVYQSTACASFGGAGPPGPIFCALSEFRSFDPNGAWSMYIYDAGNGNQGSLQYWSINFVEPQCSVALRNGGFGRVPPALSITTYARHSYFWFEGWRTTASDSTLEIWRSGFSGVLSVDDDYTTELYPKSPATLYQDVPVTANIEYRWQFAHRRRNSGDTVRFRLGEAQAVLDVAALQVIVTSVAPASWVIRSGLYTVPANVTRIRVAIEGVCDDTDAQN